MSLIAQETIYYDSDGRRTNKVTKAACYKVIHPYHNDTEHILAYTYKVDGN